MAVLKPAQSRSHLKDAVVLHLGDLRRQAQRIADEARAERDRIIKDAHEERARILEGAHEEGFAKGHTEGLEQGRAEGSEQGREEALRQHAQHFDALTQRWSQGLDEFLQVRQLLLDDASQHLLEVALDMGRAVTKRAIDVDPTPVAEQLRAVIDMTLQPTRLVIRLHPEDASDANELLPELLQRMTTSPHVDIVEDDALSRGSCIVRTDRGSVDASVNTQLESIAAALLPEPAAENNEPDSEGPSA